MATIKEIIQNFCYRINVPAPSSIVGVSSPTEQQYLSLFRFIGDNLRNRPYNWPCLKRGYYFNTETDVSNYQLPGDFYRILNSDQWDVTNQWPLQGPVSDYRMSIGTFAVLNLQIRKIYQLVGPTQYLYSTSPYSKRSAGWFQINPAGSNNTDQLFLGYVSCNWVWPRDWVASTLYTAGSIRSGNGYVYRTAAGGTSGATRPSWSTGSDSDGAVTWTVYTEPYLVDASNSALNDSDLCLFDDDIMIEGMRWAYKRAKGLDYQQERVDWEEMVKGASSRQNGPIRVNLGDELGTFGDGFPIMPVGSWNV